MSEESKCESMCEGRYTATGHCLCHATHSEDVVPRELAIRLEKEVHILEAALKATKGKRMGHVEDIVKKALREVEMMRKL